MKSRELREIFLKYFEKNKHKPLASSSLVPLNDPTLFFVNAGMVQFKDVFLGNDIRDYKRATTSQKCMRVSGKHNDLENVGRTPRHHTFFEMLGNFSFGDYFKKEAIAFGWEFLTKEVGISADRLYITVYEEDDEAEKLWQKHVDKSKIYRLGAKDNFWSMGDTGPCGPCSEIHYDMKPGGEVKAEDFDDDRFMEIWNLVFMQFNRHENGNMTKLAKPSIDTGMGLERLAAVMAGVDGNYETDLFLPVIKQIEEISGKKYSANYSAAAKDDISMRVVADHVRAMAFLIGDGVQPSNEGRGYVLRRIIRRAARHGKFLGIDKPFFVPLVHTVIDMMGASYPELIQHKSFIEKVISNEEERFNETLDKGLEILEKKFVELKADGKNILDGEDVFTLYDTYGFPKDLTEDIAADSGISIDHEGFEKHMTQQKDRARSAWKGSGEDSVAEVYKQLIKDGVTSRFVGYESLNSESEVLAIVKDGAEIDSACKDDKVSFVVQETPFYGESGGQIGDRGMAVNDDTEVEISNATKPIQGIVVHHGKIMKGSIKKGDTLALAVDAERREDIKKNHTATHLLHRALRETLGEHVKQSGSYVNDERLRFDFSHYSSLTAEEIAEIERDVNQAIRKNYHVLVEEMKHEEAVKKGALAFFGDKYGDVVRMVSVEGYSMELCGGTHVDHTGEIGMLKIVSESSVAAGIRRIEAVTGRGVEDFVNNIEKSMNDLSSVLKVSLDKVPERVSKIMADSKKYQKEIEKLRAQLISGAPGAAEADTKEIGETKLLIKEVTDVEPKDLRSIADTLKANVGSGIVAIISEVNDKTSMLIAVTKDVADKYPAGQLMKDVTKEIGGTGGGRNDMAQGGAPETGKNKAIITKLEEVIKSR